MANRAASPRLTPKFVDALAGLVIEADGTEKQAIAALLHDAAEDQGGKQTLAESQNFGADVASTVAECSDTLETPKPPWRERKEGYIRHLPEASDDAILVSLADKLDNARATLRDLRAQGNKVWRRFSVQDPQLHLWYYRSVLEVFSQRTGNWMVGELRDVIDALEQAINRQSA